jgi:hypothetical protein
MEVRDPCARRLGASMEDRSLMPIQQETMQPKGIGIRLGASRVIRVASVMGQLLGLHFVGMTRSDRAQAAGKPGIP